MYALDFRRSKFSWVRFNLPSGVGSSIGNGQLANSALFVNDFVGSSMSIGRGMPIITMDLNSRVMSLFFSLSSRRTSAPYRRKAPVKAAINTSFTEHSNFSLTALILLKDTTGKRVKVRFPLNLTYGVRSASGALIASSLSCLNKAGAKSPLKKSQGLQEPQQPPPLLEGEPRSFRIDGGMTADGRGIFAMGLPPSQSIIGANAKSKPRPSPMAWCIARKMADLCLAPAEDDPTILRRVSRQTGWSLSNRSIMPCWTQSSISRSLATLTVRKWYARSMVACRWCQYPSLMQLLNRGHDHRCRSKAVAQASKDGAFSK
mmetsp:Transcript_107758/g.310281  ORF Transcript_107758/g.310281 Transcript_107758/m.310281 type:complete len:317 (+) Transcript_107758:506-1456(+)